MNPLWGPITFSCHLVPYFGQTISCCHFWRVTFIVLGGQQYQHDNSLGPGATIHHMSTLFSTRCDMSWLVDGKFHGVASKIGDFISIWMFRGGQRQISLGADSKYQYWYWTTTNYNYSMGRASNNSPWYTLVSIKLVKGPLYRCGKL